MSTRIQLHAASMWQSTRYEHESCCSASSPCCRTPHVESGKRGSLLQSQSLMGAMSAFARTHEIAI
eukprot:scaffold18011_cov18-Tisochrysis_lutea.AAC.1